MKINDKKVKLSYVWLKVQAPCASLRYRSAVIISLMQFISGRQKVSRIKLSDR